MLTPQKKLWSGWSLSGPAGQDDDENEYINASSQENIEQSRMNMRNKLSELQNELYDYQYQMGLLLIERKEWITNYENLQQAFAETKDTLDQKQAALSDMEKREEDLRKALGVEKQVALDLEKALHKMRSQHAEIKFTSDLKLVEANALVTGIRDKSFEAESKLRAADAKEADLIRKNLEIERKLKRVEELTLREKESDAVRKSLEIKEKELLELEEKLFGLKAQTEKSREDMEEERQRIKNESEILKLTEEERLGHSLLQLELKQEIDKCKSQREQLFKEREDLKQERDRFEKEWEHLDERMRLSDEERGKEIREVNYLKGVVAKEMEEMRLESSRVENEKLEMLTNQKRLDEKRLEMRRDYDELVSLSYKLKELREQFFKEKENFLTFVEKHKSCKNCGDPFPEFVHSNLQSPASLDAIRTPALSHFTDLYSKGPGSTHDRPGSEATSRAVDLGSPASTGTMSWLQKCTSKILTLSSGKKNDPAYTNQNFLAKHVHIESPLERLSSSNDDSELQFGVAEDNLSLKHMQSHYNIREVGNRSNAAVNEQSKGEVHNVVEGSQHSDQKLDASKREKTGRSKANVRRTVKTNVTDIKLRGSAPELNKNEHTKMDQAGRKTQRKRSHSHYFQRKQSDSDYTYSGGNSDSNITLGRRKRRHVVVPPVQTTSGQRYNFRQRRT